MRILIVDDDADIAGYMQGVFEDSFSNVEVTFASNGAMALQSCYERQFDLICTDHKMPVMSGYDFVLLLRRHSGPNQKTGIVFISGYLEDFKVDAEAIENVIFLDKPPPTERLLRVASLASRVPLKKSDLAG